VKIDEKPNKKRSLSFGGKILGKEQKESRLKNYDNNDRQ